MTNGEFIKKVAYHESVYRHLHGEEAARPYTEVLRKAASLAHVEGAFEDVTFNEYGLAEGGPFSR